MLLLKPLVRSVADHGVQVLDLVHNLMTKGLSRRSR